MYVESDVIGRLAYLNGLVLLKPHLATFYCASKIWFSLVELLLLGWMLEFVGVVFRLIESQRQNTSVATKSCVVHSKVFGMVFKQKRPEDRSLWNGWLCISPCA